MKATKNQALYLTAALALLFSFSSCNKYEDGPGLSFRTKTNRLIGTWELIKTDGYYINRSGEFTIINFDRDGDFNMIGSYYDYNGQLTSFQEAGDWEWENGKEEVEIETYFAKEDWEILRLTNRELWFEIENGQIWKCEKN